MAGLDKLYAAYSDKMEFFFIYVTEAHPELAGQRSFNPQTIEQRVDFACQQQEGDARVRDFAVPMLVDDMDHSTQLAYIGFPARAVLVGRDGRIAWAGAPGPAGIRRPVSDGQAEAALKRELASRPPTEQELQEVAEEEARQWKSFYGPPAGDAIPVVLINCGASGDREDKAGRLWLKDQPFGPSGPGHVGGKPLTSRPHWVVGTRDWPIYTSAIEGVQAYRIPVQNGNYIVRLHFAEIGGAGGGGRRQRGNPPRDRVFRVGIEGQVVLEGFNLLEAAGGRTYTAVIKTFTVTVADEEISIEFSTEGVRDGAAAQPPIINAIGVWWRERVAGAGG